jgi:serine/threonine protein phosphatase PrpC
MVPRRTGFECYGASRPQQGRSPASNEDAFLIGRDRIPFVALCDGAGNAQRAAKRVLRLFERLIANASGDDVARFTTWAQWIRVLDSSLLGGAESTFVAAACIGRSWVGAYVGDSRAYVIDQNGTCRILTEMGSKFRLAVEKPSRYFWTPPAAPAVPTT